MNKKAAYTGIRAFLGCIFVVSGVAKLLSPHAAANMVSAFLGYSNADALLATSVLSALEILIGLALVFNRLAVPFAFASTLFLVSSIVVGLHFVSEPVECGCFGGIVSTKTDGFFFARNAVLLVCSMLVMHGCSNMKVD